ncbi:MAG: rhamnogalacturonan lyase family protein [Thermogutta sp.]
MNRANLTGFFWASTQPLLRVAVVIGILGACLPSPAYAQRQMEKRDRGLVAVQSGPQEVYLSWRYLREDPKDLGFHIYRQAAGQTLITRLTDRPITKTCDFVDRGVAPGKYVYFVRAVQGGNEELSGASFTIEVTEKSQPYLSIKLDGNHTFQKVGIADLNGDGQLDIVIKQPNQNIDPYEAYWKPSPGTYKLEAYTLNGKMLWRFDLGWAIEQGIWYSPYIVYDLDGDGKAEVVAKTGEGDPRDADGRVQSGPEYVTVLNGETGQPVTRVDWPARDLFPRYNYASRNQLAVAYLDGKTPALIVLRGTYNVMVAVAYRYEKGELKQIWRWDNQGLERKFQGQGAHWTHAADVDGDGKDEIILGSLVLDDNGQPLWSTGLGHPDHAYIGDLDPARPGLEIYYGIETRQEKNGMCMVDARTGKILWGYDGPTRHVHSSGMCSDIDPRYPGAECYSADTDAKKQFAWAKLWSARGEVISEENLSGFGPRVAYWDADPQRELVIGSRIRKYYPEQELSPRLEGSYVATVDLLGDWREEIIMTLPGELRIYVTTIPASDRRPCLLQDPLYRLDVAMGAMGYYQAPLPSYDLATQKPE